jgi:hypothetical protein
VGLGKVYSFPCPRLEKPGADVANVCWLTIVLASVPAVDRKRMSRMWGYLQSGRAARVSVRVRVSVSEFGARAANRVRGTRERAHPRAANRLCREPWVAYAHAHANREPRTPGRTRPRCARQSLGKEEGIGNRNLTMEPSGGKNPARQSLAKIRLPTARRLQSGPRSPAAWRCPRTQASARLFHVTGPASPSASERLPRHRGSLEPPGRR